MNYARESNQTEFKGIYYNESKEQKYFEGGAHFRYKDLYHILEKLKGYRIDFSSDKKVVIQRNDSNFKENNDSCLNKQAKTRNNNNNNATIDKQVTKQATTCRNANQKNYFLNQCIQSKYFGLSLYINQNSKQQQPLNKFKHIPKVECKAKKCSKLLSNPPKPKSSSVKRIQSEDAHSNAFAKTAIQTARQNGRETSSNTQRAKEYSEQIKSTGKGFHSRNAQPQSNANPNTFVVSQGHISTKPNKSRNSNQIGSSGLFDSLSFQTKQSWRGKDKKDSSIKNTIDKTDMKKTISIRKLCGGGSISLSNRIQKDSIDKYQKISYVTRQAANPKANKTNNNIGMKNRTMKKGFLSSYDK